MRTVAAIPSLALLAGSGCGLLVSTRLSRELLQLWRGPFRAAILAALLLTLLALVLWAWRTMRPLLLACSVAAIFFAGGALLAARAWHDASHPSLRTVFDEAAGNTFSVYGTIEGVLSRDAALSASGVSLAIAVDTFDAGGRRAAVSGGALVTVVGSLAPARLREWRAGRRVRLPVTLRRPTTYRDPDVPDREAVLARQGIALVGTAKSGALVELLARGPAWTEAGARVRQRVRDAVARTVAPRSARSAAIVTAIVIGDRAGLDPDVQRALQEAGTYHVIAISGGNIAILAGVLLAGFRLAGVLGRAAMIVAAAGLVAYAGIVGGGASVDRATLMAVIYFCMRAWDQRTPPLNTLALTAAVLVAGDPLTIADPAFVLTFGATLAILLVMPIVVSWRLPNGLRAMAAIFAASIAAELALFPIAALVFSRVTVAGLVLNFLAIPLMAVAQLAGMALVPIEAMSSLAGQAVGWIAHVGAAGLVWSAWLVRLVPFVTWRIPPPHWVAVALYYGAVTRACVASRRTRAASAACACAACAWIVAAPWRLASARGDGRLHVVFLDVGQGDATAIRFPRGATWLIDTGGLSSASPFDIGDRVVAPVLRRMGVWRLDRLVLTHGDPDHVGGAASIVREFRPREVCEGVRVPRYEPLARLAREAAASGITWRTVRAGDVAVVDGVRVAVRNPPEPEWERQRVRNDDSVVLDLAWNGVSIVLTGDVGREVEPLVGGSLDPAAIRIVKAPHHGSAGSSSDALVRRANPGVAVISAGRGNPFGHPAPAVVERYESAGGEIFRTDRDGAIFLDTDGKQVRIRTFAGRSYEPPSSRRTQR